MSSPLLTPEFLLTTLVIAATPGTGVIFTLGAGLTRGVRASLVAAFGCAIGILPHVLAAVTGLAALLNASAIAFQSIKYLGVAYLLFMAWQTWRDHGGLTLSDAPDERSPSSLRVVGRAVLVNLLNPKLTIFFFAFLPQFVHTDEPHAMTRMLALSAVFMLVTFVVFAVYGVLAAVLRTRIVSRPRVVVWMRRTFAGAFVALGARLALTER
ncbi:MAG: LysE family translocator [Brevundimonas sp.]